MDVEHTGRDVLFTLRDFLRANLVNPKDPEMSGDEWIFTARHEHDIQYPMVIVEIQDGTTSYVRDLEEGVMVVPYTLMVRVKVWADNVKHRDQIVDSITYHLLHGEDYFSERGIEMLSLEAKEIEDGKDGSHARTLKVSFEVLVE
ncbi:MAG: hypothetical protein ACXQS2_04590 [Methermicoccaceae archaeon]